jgi:crotonobetainyl-CoA:carnitine CoA-transferase CaiB-like acyl-CoA transferase
MAKFRISHAQVAQWEYNVNHHEFSHRTVINDDEMAFLVGVKEANIDLTKWWRTNDKRWIFIQAMEFDHLQNTVDYFSRDGMTIDPMRQGAFDNVMIEYLKRKVDNEALTKKAIQLMENLDGKS